MGHSLLVFVGAQLVVYLYVPCCLSLYWQRLCCPMLRHTAHEITRKHLLPVLLRPAAQQLLQHAVLELNATPGTTLHFLALPQSRARHDLMNTLPAQALNPEMSTESLTNIMTHQFVGSGRRQLHALREDWPDFRGETPHQELVSSSRSPRSCWHEDQPGPRW